LFENQLLQLRFHHLPIILGAKINLIAIIETAIIFTVSLQWCHG
jgi:hypothetical protein